MESNTQRKVLCASSAYEEKYYFNPEFDKIPAEVKKELQIIAILFTDDIGGIFVMEFDPEGNLYMRTESRANDCSYDEIGAKYMIGEIQKNKEELLESLELFYKSFILKKH